jgi:amino acid transporter
MKSISFILSFFLIVIFTLSIRNSIHSFNGLSQVSLINDAGLEGFDPLQISDFIKHSEFNELEKKISVLVLKEKTKINTLSNWEIGLNLLITLVTGFSALITTISTIKNNSISKSIAILVATITFISTLLSYSLGQVNTFKDDAENKRKKIIQIREELESLKPSEINEQLPLFNRRLNEEL